MYVEKLYGYGTKPFISLKKNLFSSSQSFLQLMALNDGTSTFFLQLLIAYEMRKDRLFCIMF